MDKNNIIWANIQNLGGNIPYLDNFYGFPGDKLLILSVGGKQLSFPGDLSALYLANLLRWMNFWRIYNIRSEGTCVDGFDRLLVVIFTIYSNFAIMIASV
jgi:hypothetical protein